LARVAETEALASFVAKWRQRQPEMALVDPFCAPSERPLLVAWGALGNELALAMFETSDASVSRTKLAWFGDDLAAGRNGARHPLARALLAASSDRQLTADAWRQLALAAIALADAAREAPGPRLPETAAQRFGERLAMVESVLFGAPSDAAAVCTGIALEHLLRHGVDPQVTRTESSRLLAAAPAANAAVNLFRGVRLTVDRWQLRRLASGTPGAALSRPPAWRALWMVWSAARRSRRITPDRAVLP
jgi:hypothetical protein